MWARTVPGMTTWRKQVRRARAIVLARVAMRVGAVVDVETTDLDGRVVQVGVCDLHGRVLIDELVRAPEPIAAGARAVHGICDQDCAGARSYAQLHDELRQVLRGRLVVAYNAPYDRGVLAREATVAGVRPAAGRWRWWCVMRARAAVDGGPWQRLDAGHTAAGDALAAARVVADLSRRPLWSAS